MNKLCKILMVFAACAAFSSAVAEEVVLEEEITVVISGIEAKTGVIAVSIFDDEEKFLEDPLIFRRVNVDGNSEVTLSVNLVPGDYALNVYHDLDDDGKMNKNFFGIPKEPVGFSNGAVAKMGPPSFVDAVVDTETTKVISVVLGET